MKVFSRILLCWPVIISVGLICAALGLETAFVEVVIYEQSGGDYTTYTYKLKGHFSDAGAATSAEGDILEVEPSGLCNATDSSGVYKYGWVGVVKLTTPDREVEPCLPLFEKAKRAIQRGATAVIFDTTDDLDAVEELNHVSKKMKRPVVLLSGQDANKLMNIVKNQKVARARIQFGAAGYTPQRASRNEYFDMVIFMTFFILVSIVCFSLLLKIKWRQRQKESSLTRMALHALSRMETRKFCSTASMECVTSPEEADADVGSTTSQTEDLSAKCVICLEKFKNGQDVRIVPCRHEFHKDCVDPWLLSNYTCPLCMLNIVEKEGCHNKPRRGRRWLTTRCGRCFSGSGTASSTSSIFNFPIEMSLATSPSQEIPINSDEDDGTAIITSANPESSSPSTSVDLLSSRVLSNSCPSVQISQRNCEEHNVCNGSSWRHSARSLGSFHGFSGPGKTYMHQVVVVAPVTAGMLDVSQEDIV